VLQQGAADLEFDQQATCCATGAAARRRLSVARVDHGITIDHKGNVWIGGTAAATA